MPSLAVLLDSSRIAIQSHTCPKCVGPVVLSPFKPSRIGFELRTFQGVNCDHVDKVANLIDEMDFFRLRAPVWESACSAPSMALRNLRRPPSVRTTTREVAVSGANTNTELWYERYSSLSSTKV
jgi:hypothetical protein